MAITNLNTFLESYFIAHDCQIIDKMDGLLTVKLTEEMDKALMNRPFYWHYIKGTGNKGEPSQLTLITNPNKRDEQGEWIHFGSSRLQQIINHLKDNERYVQLFHIVKTTNHVALHPWLITNIKVSYLGKHKKDEVFSIGLNLITGIMKVNMMQLLRNIPLHVTMSNYCYTLSPLIKIQSGFDRIKKVIDNYLMKQQHEWANDSIEILKDEVHLVQQFYNLNEDGKQLQREIDEINERYAPRIIYEVINGGIIYLTTDFQES